MIAEQKPHVFHPSIFREYDIRGIFNETLFTPDAYQIGKNYAALLGRGKICVGYDGRLSSPELSASLIRSLTDYGIDVIDIGIAPTPLLYFSVFEFDADGGIMVTGSHNPGSHNGFKIMLGKESLHGEQIKALAEDKGNISKAKGKHEELSISDQYINKLLVNTPRKFKVGFDPGNGAAGNIAAELASILKAKIINADIDGSFPNHHPDPSVEKNLEQLKQLVLENSLDVGFAFDGDGDRLGVIDDLGRPIWGDQILAILAHDILKKYPGAPIIADVKTSQAVFDHITKLGGRPEMCRTGHSLVKARMKELKSPLAGEMSAHIFIADDYYGFDDGIYAAMRFLQAMANSGKKSSVLLDELPKTFSTPEIKLNVLESDKFKIVEKVKAALSADKRQFIAIDGVRVNSDEGWWLLRASNTGAYLVVRCEGKSEESLRQMRETLQTYLTKIGLKL